MSELPLQRDIALAPLTTLGVPATARWYLRAQSVEILRAGLDWARQQGLPVFVLGGGSNVVFAEDWPGLVLQPALRGRALEATSDSHFIVKVDAGENWHDTVAWTLEQRWPGLENLALIPGSVGAAPVQNIGAYGLELEARFHSLDALDSRSGTLVTLDHTACRFAYRDSILKHEDGRHLIVTAVRFALPRAWTPCLTYRELAQQFAGGETPTPRVIFDAVVAIRRRKLPDPAELGNVGSFFKNPVVDAATYAGLHARFPDLVAYPQAEDRYKLAAGWLIDRAGWKGRRIGAAGVHAQQALVLVNLGGARGADILALADAVRTDVAERFGVELEQEPQRPGALPA
ncbi:UDP-N-acetylmuramate dehydrogenase [Niveibacterium sp. SC-1]|uniref:UDP-N-acetylmuramate dehydrogenase n=1 Tax=Niveibacterium sp. SC-1 TaxID=3135646 RepID=UPI00311E8538